MHKRLKSSKANSNPQNNIHYCPTWAAPQKKGRPKQETRRKSIADHITQLVKKKCRTTVTTNTPEEERVDLEGKDGKDGQEAKPSEHGVEYSNGKFLGYHCSSLGRFTSGNLEVCDNSKVRLDHV